MANIIFTTPDIKYKDTFIKGVKEFQDNDKRIGQTEDRLDINDLQNNFEKYLEKWDNESKGVNLKPNYVPATIYWLIVDGKYVGRASLRHALNDNLLKLGGHIGYGVVPSERRKGYGTEILRRTLIEAKKLGIEKALITCDENNIGSRKVIENNGGVLENIVPQGEGLPAKYRFWISLI